MSLVPTYHREIGIAHVTLHREFIHQPVTAEDVERLLANLVAAVGGDDLDLVAPAISRRAICSSCFRYSMPRSNQQTD